MRSKTIEITEQDRKTLDGIVKICIHKQGFSRALDAIMFAISLNEFNYITRQDNARELATNLGSDKIKEIIHGNRHNIMDNNMLNAIFDYYADVIDDNPDVLEQANKFYDVCSQIESKNIDNLLNSAVFHYVSEGDFDFIGKENLQNNNIKPEDANILMLIKIHKNGKDNNEFLRSNIEGKLLREQTEIFSEIVKSEVKSKAAKI